MHCTAESSPPFLAPNTIVRLPASEKQNSEGILLRREKLLTGRSKRGSLRSVLLRFQQRREGLGDHGPQFQESWSEIHHWADFLTGKAKENESCNRMDRMDGTGEGAFDAAPDRDGEESVGGGIEISYRASMEAAILVLQNEREVRSIYQNDQQHHPDLRYHQIVAEQQDQQQHTDRESNNVGFESTIPLRSGGDNRGLREGMIERETSYSHSVLDGISTSEHFEFHEKEKRSENDRKFGLNHESIQQDTGLMPRKDGEGMILDTEQGQDHKERQAIFGALAAAAVAVNVALHSNVGAGSIALNPSTAGSCFEHKRFRKRKRKNEEEDLFIPAVLSTFADAEGMASFALAESSPKKDHPFLFDDCDWFLKPRSRRWWRKLFRVSKPTFDYICQLVKPDIQSDTPASFQGIEGRVITVEKQVAIALRRLASGDSLTILGDLFGVGESTVSKVIWKFVNSMEKRARHHMQWPEGDEMERVKTGFEVDHGLPNCCGVIDLTHIIMELPGQEVSMDWLDREQNYSMLVQIVVDKDMKIRDLFTGWPGSITDSRLLRNSGFFAVCESGERLNGTSRTLKGIEVREYIIGDSGYPLLPWLINPYTATGSSPSRDTFNSKHASTKIVADGALGRLKGAWKILHKVLWRPDIRKLPKIVLVCCLLHNILIDAGEEMEDGVGLVGHHDEGYRQQRCLSVEPEGHLIREALAE